MTKKYLQIVVALGVVLGLTTPVVAGCSSITKKNACDGTRGCKWSGKKCLPSRGVVFNDDTDLPPANIINPYAE